MNKDKIRELVDNKYQLRRQLKARLERQARHNINCYKGYQWYKDQETDFSIVEAERDTSNYYEPSIVVNHILPLVTQRIATMTKTKPIITAIPRTSDMDDIDKAHYTDMSIDYAWQKFNLSRKLIRTLLDCEACGKSFWKHIWNKNLGEEKEDVVDYKESTDGNGMVVQMPVMGRFRTGEIEVIPVSGRNIIVDPLATSDEEVSWMLHFYIKPIRQVAFIHRLKDEELAVDESIYDDAMNRLPQGAAGQYSTGADEGERGVIVKELYYAPDNQYPKGLYAKVAGGKLLEYSEMPKEAWPFVSFCMQENTDSYWGEGIITHIAPINQELNDVRSHMMSYQKKMVYGYWVNPPESGVDDDEIEAVNGGIFHPRSMNKEQHPYRIDPPPFPNGLFNMADSYVFDMEQIANIHQASRGQNPEGNRSASGLNLMQEQDQMALGPAAIMLEESLTGAARKILELMKENYDDDRMIAVVGENGVPQIEAFKRDNIVLDDLRATLFSSLPRSRAGQTQQLFELIDRGVFTQDQLPKVLDSFGIGSLASITDENKLVAEEAKREYSDLFNQDVMPRVYEFQDHAGHGKEHTLSMMTYQAKALWDVEFGANGGDPREAYAPAYQDPQTGQIMQEHIKTYGEIAMEHYHAHQEIQQSLMMKQVQIQAQMQLAAQQMVQAPQAEAQQAAEVKAKQEMEEQRAKANQDKMQDKLMDAAIQEHAAQRGAEQNVKSQIISEAIARSRPQEKPAEK
jgi:hypothetical protein